MKISNKIQIYSILDKKGLTVNIIEKIVNIVENIEVNQVLLEVRKTLQSFQLPPELIDEIVKGKEIMRGKEEVLPFYLVQRINELDIQFKEKQIGELNSDFSAGVFVNKNEMLGVLIERINFFKETRKLLLDFSKNERDFFYRIIRKNKESFDEEFTYSTSEELGFYQSDEQYLEYYYHGMEEVNLKSWSWSF